MSQERTWNTVGPISLTADGTNEGVLQISDTAGFYFGMQATLKNDTPTQLTVYIKKVVNNTTLYVGATKGGLDHNIDISSFTVATASSITAIEQNKVTVPNEARDLSTYETDPVDAWRSIAVDSYGNHYNDQNPFPVAFDGNVSIGDVSIVEGGNTLTVNPDGSINVIVESVPSPNTVVISKYAEVLAVAAGETIQIVSYTVPPSTQGVFQKASFSGENIARYDLLINNVQQDTARTMFGSDLTGEFNFTTGNDSGYTLVAGTTISIQVYNSRPSAADFEARIQVLQIPV